MMRRLSLGENGVQGLVFQVCRVLQFACLIAIIGMTSYFVNQQDNTQEPPLALISVLCIMCLGVLYVISTCILYFRQQLQKQYTAAGDIVFFLTLTSASIVLGRPVSLLSCKAFGSVADTRDAAATANAEAATGHEYTTHAAGGYDESAAEFLNAALAATPTMSSSAAATAVAVDYRMVYPRVIVRDDSYTQTLDYWLWIGGEGSTSACVMTKAVWGLAIVSAILFAFSTLCLVFLRKKERAPMGKEFVAV